MKIIAERNDDKFEYPITIYRLDMILRNNDIQKQNINLYTEIDFPYLTKQKICYSDKNGEITCLKFSVEESKVIFEGKTKQNAKKIFNLK